MKGRLVTTVATVLTAVLIGGATGYVAGGLTAARAGIALRTRSISTVRKSAAHASVGQAWHHDRTDSTEGQPSSSISGPKFDPSESDHEDSSNQESDDQESDDGFESSDQSGDSEAFGGRSWSFSGGSGDD